MRDNGIHRCILQHVGHNEEADHAPPDVDLIELRYASVTTCDSNVPQCDVQVVFGCGRERLNMLVHELNMGRTFRKFSTVELTCL